MTQSRIIRDFPFEIDERSVLRHQGYRKSSPVADRVKGMFTEAVSRARELAQPRGIWKIEKTGDCPIFLSKQVERLLRGCVEVVLFAVTAGSAIEAEVSRLMEEGEMAEAVMLDSIASEVAEGCAIYLNKLVRSDAHRRSLHLTPRFSPGFGDWPLERQRDLFVALDPSHIGIKLTESCVMIPRKSISALLGLGPIDAIRTGASPCRECK